MKRGLSVFLVLVMLLAFSITSFADMGAPNIKEFNAYVGLDGVEAEYYADNGNSSVKALPAGTIITIDYANEDGTYYFYGKIKDNFFKGMIASENFTTGKQVVAPRNKLDKSVTVSVTPDVGVNLRCGPSTNFPVFTTLKQGVKLEYTSVFKNEGMEWGFTNYKGQSGWISLKYVSEVEETTTKAAETTTQATTLAEIVLDENEQEDTSNGDSRSTYGSGSAQPRYYGSGSFAQFLAANNTVVICIISALILALTAAVIILLVSASKKKKNNANNANAVIPAQEFTTPDYSQYCGGGETEVLSDVNNSVTVCPVCGATVQGYESFCSNCGNRLR